MKYEDVLGAPISVGDYVVYHETGRYPVASVHSMRVGVVVKLTPKRIAVEEVGGDERYAKYVRWHNEHVQRFVDLGIKVPEHMSGGPHFRRDEHPRFEKLSYIPNRECVVVNEHSGLKRLDTL